jgi:hypothetical protein
MLRVQCVILCHEMLQKIRPILSHLKQINDLKIEALTFQLVIQLPWTLSQARS